MDGFTRSVVSVGGGDSMLGRGEKGFVWSCGGGARLNCGVSKKEGSCAQIAVKVFENSRWGYGYSQRGRKLRYL